MTRERSSQRGEEANDRAAQRDDGNGSAARQYGLTAGTLGVSAAQVLMVALLPVLLARDGAGTFMIGLVIASEGFFSLVVPYPVGRLSDSLPDAIARRVGRRNVVLLCVAPIMAVALVLVPLLEGFWTRAAAAFVFFAALHAYRTPLWTLTVESVPDDRWGRVEGVRGAFHAGGVGYALVGGGLLFAVWPPLPFVVGAALIIVTTVATFIATPRDSAERDSKEQRDDGAAERAPGALQTVRERRDVRWFLIAHSLWTGAVDGIRPFIFLFATVVLGISIAQSSLVLLVLLLGLAIGAVVIGRLGDRYGRGRLLGIAALVLGVAMCSGIFIRSVPVAIAVLVPVGVTAAAFISLPYPYFASLVGENGIGEQTGLYNAAIGIAQIASPLLVGGALALGEPIYPDLDGFPLMWPVVGAMGLLSAVALRRAEQAGAGNRAAH